MTSMIGNDSAVKLSWNWRAMVASMPALSIVVALGLTFLGFFFLKGKSHNFATYLILLLSIIYLPGYFQHLRRDFRNPIILLSFCLLIYLACSAFWSPPSTGMDMLKQFERCFLVFSFLICLKFALIRFPWLARTLFIIVITMAVVAAIYGLIMFLQSNHPLPRMVAMGRLQHPILAAAIFGWVMIFSLVGFFRVDQNWLKYCLLLVSILMSIAVVLSSTRSVMVAIPAAIVALLWLETHWRSQLVLLALTFILLFTFFSFWLPAEDLEPVLRGTSFRTDIWQASWIRIIEGNWLIGEGILTPSEIKAIGSVFSHPHNMYLGTLLYGGIVGLGLLIALLYQSFRVCIANRQHLFSVYVIISLFFSCVFLIFDTHLIMGKIDIIWMLIWVPVAMAAVVYEQSQVKSMGSEKG